MEPRAPARVRRALRRLASDPHIFMNTKLQKIVEDLVIWAEGGDALIDKRSLSKDDEATIIAYIQR